MSDLPEPLPPDPRSIDVWPTFLAGCRTWFRLALPLTLLFVGVIVPVAFLAGWSMPTLSAAMFGHVVEDIPPRELFGMAGVMVLAFLGGGLASIAVSVVADHALAGDPVPGPGATADRVLERVLPVVGAWIVYMVTVLVPMLLLVGVLIGMVAIGGDSSPGTEPTPLFIVGFIVAMLLIYPPLIAIAIYGHFTPIRAALRARGPLASWRDSLALVRGRWWRTFGFLMLANVAVQAVATGGLMLAYVGFALHPMLGVVVYAAAIALCFPFQLVQQVALMRRLESLTGLVPPSAAIPAMPALP